MGKDEKSIKQRVGKRWRESVDKIKEYEIIEGEEEDYREFIPSITFGVDYREYQEAGKLKQKLLKKYKGKILEEVIEGDELKTKYVDKIILTFFPDFWSGILYLPIFIGGNGKRRGE